MIGAEYFCHNVFVVLADILHFGLLYSLISSIESISNCLVSSASPSSYCSILGDSHIKSAGSTASDP